MTDFALGAYSALTVLMALVLAVLRARLKPRPSVLEIVITVMALVCWPLLALAVAIATFIQWALRK